MVLILWCIIFLGSIHTFQAACPYGWRGNSALSSCYLYNSITKKMVDARKYCYEHYKAVLAMHKTEQENNFLISIYAEDVFIGMTDYDANGHWEYLDGDDVQTSTATFSYNPWATHPGSDTDNCAVMVANGNWMYEGCSNQKAFVCEKDFSISGWYKDPYDDICYKTFGEETYTEALDTCAAAGYDILMPKFKRQHRFIQWILNEYIHNVAWIGFTDLYWEGTFRRHSGSDTGFRGFSSGEPNNLNGEQDCVRYDDLFGEYEWNDWRCSSISTKTVCQEPESKFITGGDATSSYVISSVYTTAIITDVVTTDGATTDISTDVFSTVYPEGFCPCSCVSTNLSTSDVMLYIAKLQQELKVNVETLSSTVRSKTCADDPRRSARNIGMVGVFVLAMVFSLIVLIDLISFFFKYYFTKDEEVRKLILSTKNSIHVNFNLILTTFFLSFRTYFYIVFSFAISLPERG